MAQFSVHPWDQELVFGVTITSSAEIGERRRMENFTCFRCCWEQESPSWKPGLPAETRYPLPFCICIWNSATPASFSIKKGKVDSSSRKLWCECTTGCRSCSCSSWTGSSLVTAILRRNSYSRDSAHDKDHFYRLFLTAISYNKAHQNMTRRARINENPAANIYLSTSHCDIKGH